MARNSVILLLARSLLQAHCALWVHQTKYAEGDGNCNGTLVSEAWYLQDTCHGSLVGGNFRHLSYNETSDRIIVRYFGSGTDCLAGEKENLTLQEVHVPSFCQTNGMRLVHNVSWDEYLETSTFLPSEEDEENLCGINTGDTNITILNKCVKMGPSASWRYSSTSSGVSHMLFDNSDCQGTGACQFTHSFGCPVPVIVGCNKLHHPYYVKHTVHGSISRYRPYSSGSESTDFVLLSVLLSLGVAAV
eukprot:gb/GFBE01077583.1/.p1 GENE.gb/GFBE01077583.1/~~gb/GFBE01077583.1/.p1  ORF type:complete len:246 (+),score=32.06 gb/GFBE01077583.1/:1-738(+)